MSLTQVAPSPTAIAKTRAAVDSLPAGPARDQLHAAIDHLISEREDEWCPEVTARGLLTRGECLADIRENVEQLQAQPQHLR